MKNKHGSGSESTIVIDYNTYTLDTEVYDVVIQLIDRIRHLEEGLYEMSKFAHTFVEASYAKRLLGDPFTQGLE